MSPAERQSALARPSKYTPERERLVLEAISGGATRRAAALHAGIDEATLYNWLNHYSSFSGRIARAEADVEVRCTALILRAAEMDPRHAEWWLERRRPDDYGRRERVTADGRLETDTTIRVQYADMATPLMRLADERGNGHAD